MTGQWVGQARFTRFGRWARWSAIALVCWGFGQAAGAASSGTGDCGPSGDAASGHHLSIVFDYRFDDRGFFRDPVRRRVLEAAAAAWSARLGDDFRSVAAGTPLRTRDPEQPSAPGVSLRAEQPIDDVWVFVACADLRGRGVARSNHSAAIYAVPSEPRRGHLQARYRGADFEPWTGWIAFSCEEDWFFDPTPAGAGDVPPRRGDMLSTAMHELGHVLGFGTADAFHGLVDARGRFTGACARAVYGGPVPLAADRRHLAPEVRFDGERQLMAPSRRTGRRTPPGRLETAILADLGYRPLVPLLAPSPGRPADGGGVPP